jgi:dTDP-4-amino-4,6-dideoxygalactose transaminase
VVRSARREALREHLARQGIQTLVHYPVPPHRQPAYASLRNLRLPLTDRLHAEVLSLPMAAVLRDDQVERVVEACMSYPDDP